MTKKATVEPSLDNVSTKKFANIFRRSKYSDYLDRQRAEKKSKKDLFTPKQLLHLLKTNPSQFKFDFKGHINIAFQDKYVERAIEEMIRSLEFEDTYYKEVLSEMQKAKAEGKDYYHSKDDKNPTKNSEIEKSYSFYTKSIEAFETLPLKVGESPCRRDNKLHCFKCGEDLPYCFIDENTISVSPSYYMIEKDIEDPICPFKDGQKPIKCKISVPTGELVFSNWFDDRKTATEADKDRDCYVNMDKKEMEIFEPKDRWSREFGINDFIGRVNMAKNYAEKHNIAYAQMGNMSIGIFINEAKDKIIIGNYYRWEGENDTDGKGNKIPLSKDHQKAKDEKFKFVGYISLTIWRWMATDMDVIKKNDIPIKKMKGRDKRSYDNEAIVLKVKKGVWEMTHYYDSDEFNDDNFVYSTLELVKE